MKLDEGNRLPHPPILKNRKEKIEGFSLLSFFLFGVCVTN